MTTADTECGNVSPINDQESRETATLECKHTSNKSDNDVRLQLQVNMYHLLVREFTGKLNDVSSLQSLSSFMKLTYMVFHSARTDMWKY